MLALQNTAFPWRRSVLARRLQISFLRVGFRVKAFDGSGSKLPHGI